MWVSARCPVDVCLDYAYNKKQLQVTELRSLGKGAGGDAYIASVSGKTKAPIGEDFGFGVYGFRFGFWSKAPIGEDASRLRFQLTLICFVFAINEDL